MVVEQIVQLLLVVEQIVQLLRGITEGAFTSTVKESAERSGRYGDRAKEVAARVVLIHK